VASIFVPPDEKLSGTGPREFSNDAEGFESFRSWLTSHEQLTQSDTLVCVEQTGVYSEALCYDLRRAGFEIVLLDPHAVWKAFKDELKTDELDSRRIGEYGYRYRDQLDRWTPNETVAEQVKTLLTAREQLDKQKTATQNARQSLERKAVQTPAAVEALQKTADHLAGQSRKLSGRGGDEAPDRSASVDGSDGRES
jgi:transposase